jgi:hypothetical protein
MRIRAAINRAMLGVLCGAALLVGIGVPTAQAAFDDPLFVVRPTPTPPPSDEAPEPPPPIPPPAGNLEGPCGLAVGASANLYVSNYYHHTIDLFGSNIGKKYPYGYVAQLTGVDPLDGPCGLALDSSANLYVNNFHRNVVRIAAGFGATTVIAGAGAGPGLEATRPTGVAVNKTSDDVYVDERTQVAVFDSSGAAKGIVGLGSLEDGYGLAVSEYPATAGLLYVPDAGSNTVKVYSPEPPEPTTAPVAEIDGSDTPLGHFRSLRNSAVAVDNSTGEIYVADVLEPEFSELSETVIHVFDSAGGYEGRLKISIENALPPGLAVDNSGTATQGRVYVTSGNTELAAVYAYPAHAATSVAVPLPKPAAPAALPGPGSSLGADPPAAVAAVGLASVGGDVAGPAPNEAAARAVARRSRARARHRKAGKSRAAKLHRGAPKGHR